MEIGVPYIPIAEARGFTALSLIKIQKYETELHFFNDLPQRVQDPA